MSCIPGVTSMKECSKNIQHQSAKKKRALDLGGLPYNYIQLIRIKNW